MQSQEGRRLAEVLTQRVGNDADAEQIAEAVVSTWHEIAAALTPILGKQGVAAIYRRSAHLSGDDHPWLLGIHEDVEAVMDLERLKTVVGRQTRADAATGSGAFLHNFHDLLSSLIGSSLTDRLLRRVLDKPPSDPPEQDSPP